VRGYFPQAAFDPDRCEQIDVTDDGYVPGASFRTLLTRRPESNLMYAKMHYIHILVNQIRGDKYRKQLAREELWRGQCHAAYWKGGLAGGIYSNRLRKQVYASLIEAEKVTREKGIFSPSIITVDFDMDGLSEFLYQGQEINAYVHKQGGVIFELDYLPVPWNYGDSLAENAVGAGVLGNGGALRAGASDDGVAAGPVVHSRDLFVDHFFDEPAVSATVENADSERGDFTGRLYSVRQLSKDGHKIHLAAFGNVVDGRSGRPVPVEIHKEYGFEGATIHLTYRLRNRGTVALQTNFASEINLSLGGNDEEALRILAGRGSGATLSRDSADWVDGVDSVRIYDLHNDVLLLLNYDDATGLSSAPVEVGAKAVSAPYQASRFLPQWHLELEPGAEWTQKVSLAVVAE
jgi:alpha-amylase